MRHGLLLYGDDETMLGRMAPFLQEGLDGGDPVVVILDRRKRELLVDVLGSDPDEISYVDRDTFYTRPLDALARYDVKLRQLVRDGAGTVRVFAELPRCSESADVDAWISYEAIVNRALAHHPLWVICGYDVRELPEPLVESALETHPEVLTDHWECSDQYRPPEAAVRFRPLRPGSLENLHPLPVDAGPRAFCYRLSAELELAGVPESAAADMLVAAGEVLTNAQQHGGDRVTAQAGRVDDRFVCEVCDNGPGIDDPLAGFVPPRPRTPDSAGLWVARQLTRALEFVPAQGGFTVRLWADEARG